MTGTSGRQRVPISCFDSFEVVIPPKRLADRFAQLAHIIISIMKQHDSESFTLADMRHALLPKLLSGDIRLIQAQRYVEASNEQS